MTGITNAELTDIRSAIEDLLPGTCNILSATRTSDSQGGYTETWGTATADLSCRIDNVSKSEQLFGGVIQPFTGFVLSLPWDTTITTAHRVEIGSTYYNVRGVDNGKSWNAVVRALIEEV